MTCLEAQRRSCFYYRAWAWLPVHIFVKEIDVTPNNIKKKVLKNEGYKDIRKAIGHGACKTPWRRKLHIDHEFQWHNTLEHWNRA